MSDEPGTPFPDEPEPASEPYEPPAAHDLPGDQTIETAQGVVTPTDAGSGGGGL
jgi:hypothetical protein